MASMLEKVLRSSVQPPQTYAQATGNQKKTNEQDRVFSPIFNNVVNSDQSESATRLLEGRVVAGQMITPTDDKVKVFQPTTNTKVAEVEEVSGIQHGKDTKEVAMKKKSGRIWECIKMIPDSYGGFLYSFRPKKKYEASKDRMSQKRHDIFPALEPIPSRAYLTFNEDINETYLQCKVERKVKEAKRIFDLIFHPNHQIYKDKDVKQKQSSFKEYLVKKEFPTECLNLICYTFDEFSSLEEWKAKLNEMVPILANSSYPDKKHRSTLSRHVKFFNELGYSSYKDSEGHIVLTLPDRQALLARWDLIMKKNLDLPKLNIADASGIAGDMEFVKAYILHDALLSDGKEFIHDHMYHITRVISLILSGDDNQRDKIYSKEKHRLVELVDKAYRKIIFFKQKNDGEDRNITVSEKDLEKIEMTLASVVDIISAQLDYSVTKTFTEEVFVDLVNWIWLMHPPWMDCLKTRFKGEILDLVHLNKVCQQIWTHKLL